MRNRLWECYTGDIGDQTTICHIWNRARYAKTLSAGYNCQPYSRLGDGKGGKDPRSSCLTKVLKAAVALQGQLLVVECVLPTVSDEFVKGLLAKFQRLTGFEYTQIDLRLQDIWPTRRDRSWWIYIIITVVGAHTTRTLAPVARC